MEGAVGEEVEAESYSQETVWQRCARKLPLNSVERLIEFQNIASTIISNCANNPQEEKYFVIKASNKTIQQKLLSNHGSTEFMVAVGFYPSIVDGQKIFSLSTDTPVQHLTLASEWLDETVNTCLLGAESRSGTAGSNQPCADCIVQIRLPIGTSVTGGFFFSDTVQDVLGFVQCYFKPTR